MKHLNWLKFRLLLWALLWWNRLLILRCWLKGGDTEGLRDALADELQLLLRGGNREARLQKLRGEE